MAALVAAIAMGGCGSVAPSSPSASVPAPSRTPPAPPSTAIPSAPPTERPTVAVDPTLLEVLPADVDGIERRGDAGTAAEIAGSSDIAVLAEAVAVALYAAPASGVGDPDYAVVTVTRVRAGLLDATFHRDWRDSFDAAVCAQAGGVEGHAEAEIAGHRTFIGTCAGGVRTYHVVLPDARTLVSLQALGDGRLGERIVAGLAE